jgi:hypothetical protein
MTEQIVMGASPVGEQARKASPTRSDMHARAASSSPPGRCVVVVDEALAPGLAANAAAVLALTLGATVDGLVGADLVDADGRTHPGLIPLGLPVLAAPRAVLGELRGRAAEVGVGVVAFPAFGQTTNDYEAVRRLVAGTSTTDLEFLGLALYGSRRAVARLTGALRLL